MPKSRSPGFGRPCLVVGSRGESALLKILGDAGFDVEAATTEQEGRVALDRRAWALVCLAQGIGKAGLQSLIVQAGERRPAVPVIVLGVAAKMQDAVDAMQLGAADFIAPPFSVEGVVPRLKKVVSAGAGGAAEPAGAPQPLEHLGLTGRSAAMGRVYRGIARISRYKTNVLVLGESGSGKELVARALHALGPRRNQLFVPLNCATLGRDILENELFGHERGAFTGANERKKGLFELADGGTLFLDEIGELDPSTQAKLLRVIERNEFRRVGGTGKIKVDLSIIAATNRDLGEAIATKRFREDLYYRLKVVTVHVPPLRERREDIPALIDAFIADFNRRNEGKIRGLAPDALRVLTEHEWPGNVRELKNAVESAAIMASGDTIVAADLESLQLRTSPGMNAVAAARAPGSSAPPPNDALPISSRATLAEAERVLIRDRLARSRTKADAARSLGIGLRTLYTKIGDYGLGADEGKVPRGRAGSAR
jgi:DNA-binding NtrC family response regulator